MAVVGDVLGGRYRLDSLLREGGFGQVFLGTDLLLKRQVAVKVAHPWLAEDATFLSRFTEEAQRVASLDHANILPVWDYGRVGSLAYLIMPYIAGGTLQDKLGSAGRLSLLEVGGYLRQAAAALDHAHARGIVHRDVKPLNMLLRADGHLFLADFGIAKVLGDTDTSVLTRAVGTLAYMAPEQFDGKVSRAGDIHALGCVLFQMLTSAPPYVGTQQQLIRGHLLEPIPSLRARGGSAIPTTLEQVLARALAKRPQDRFPSAGELVAAFEAAIEGAKADPTLADITQVATPQPVTMVVDRAPRAGRMRRRALILGGATLGVSATLGGLFALRGGVNAPRPGALIYQADWTARPTEWASTSDWTTTGGLLVNDGTGNGALLVPDYQPGDIADYAVETEVQAPRGIACGKSFGISARRDIQAGTGYYGQILSCEPRAAIGILTGDTNAGTNTTSQRFDPQVAWHTYRLEVKGPRIGFLIDGVLVAETSDSRYTSGGQLGIWSIGVHLNARSFKVFQL